MQSILGLFRYVICRLNVIKRNRIAKFHKSNEILNLWVLYQIARQSTQIRDLNQIVIWICSSLAMAGQYC